MYFPVDEVTRKNLILGFHHKIISFFFIMGFVALVSNVHFHSKVYCCKKHRSNHLYGDSLWFLPSMTAHVNLRCIFL